MNAKSALAITVGEVLIENAIVAAAGVYQHVAPREEDLPYVIYMFRPRLSHKGLKTELREYQLVVKVCATPRGGYSAEGVAEPIKSAVMALLSDSGAQARLNAKLHDLGWTSTVPLEISDLEEYSDAVGANKDIQRFHFGNLFTLRVSQL